MKKKEGTVPKKNKKILIIILAFIILVGMFSYIIACTKFGQSITSNIKKYAANLGIALLSEDDEIITLSTSGDSTYNIYGDKAFTEEYSVGAFLPDGKARKIDIGEGFKYIGEGIGGDYVGRSIYVASNPSKKDDIYIDMYDEFAMGTTTYDVRIYTWLVEGDDYALKALTNSMSIQSISKEIFDLIENETDYDTSNDNTVIGIEIHFYESGTLESENPVEVSVKGIGSFQDLDVSEGIEFISGVDKNTGVYLTSDTTIISGSALEEFNLQNIYKRDVENAWLGTVAGNGQSWQAIHYQFESSSNEPLQVYYYAVGGLGTSISSSTKTVTYHILSDVPEGIEYQENPLYIATYGTYTINSGYNIKGLNFSGWKIDSINGTDVTGNQKTLITENMNLYGKFTMDIYVTKEWDDEENHDGKRPSSITATLYKDGESTGDTIELNESNGWSGTFKNVDYSSNYTVKEEENSDYEASYSNDGKVTYNEESGKYKVTITNTHTPEITEITVTKIWDDENNVANKRPENVTIKIEGDQDPAKAGNEVSKEYTLTQANVGTNANEWTYTFTNLPKYNIYGNEITYTIAEELPENIFYTKENSKTTGDMKLGFTITNTFEVPDEKVELTVNKVWEDNDIQAQRRPETIKINILGENQEIVQSYDLDTKTETSHTFTELPKYNRLGNEINYTVSEEENSKFYAQKNISGNMQEGYTITNEFTKPDDTIDLTVNKTWEDNGNVNGKRPDSIELIVTGDGQTHKQTVQKQQNNTWTTVFENLQKYDENGQEINYTVSEEEVETGDLYFYKNQGVTGDVTNGLTITNKFTVPDERITVKVTKNWEDTPDQQSNRSEEVTVVLKGNDQTQIYNLTNAENWEHTFTNLPKYDENGNEINYTVDEVTTNEFYTKKTITGDMYAGYVITNTFTRPEDTIKVEATKVWEDNNNEAGKRVQSVTLQIKNGAQVVDTAVVEAEDEWKHEFTVQKYDENGDEITYTVDEVDLGSKFYTKESVTGNMSDGFVITNKFEVPDEKVEITVNKVWEDNETQAQRRPSEITINVLGENQEIVQTYNLNTKTETSHTFTNLPKYNKLGDEINYTVEETEKNTDDLYFYEGQVGEVTNIQGETNKKETTITNTFKKPNDTISLTVNKVWNDNETQAQRRPNSIRIVVKNGTTTVRGQEINATDNAVAGKENQWAITFTGLDKYDENGQEIKYTVDEEEVNEGDLHFYSNKEVTDVEDNQATIRNTFKLPDDTIDLAVNKVWDDSSDVNGKRPESIRLVLTGNGKTYNKTVQKQAEDTWQAVFEGLPKYDDNGEEIEYTLEEREVTEGDLYFYENEGVTGDIEQGLTITNKFTVPDDKISVTVNKVWVDNEIQEERRPESIVLILNKKVQSEEGTTQGGTTQTGTQNIQEVERKEINAENMVSGNKDRWQYTFTGLDKYDDKGQEIEYTVEEAEKEPEDMKFYKTTIGNMANEVVDGKATGNKIVTITNTFTKPDEKVEVPVTKVWDDSNNEAQKRPESIKVQLKDETGVTVKEQEINSTENAVSGNANEWQVIFDNLEKYDDNGKEKVYTADETEVNSSDLQFYTKQIEGTTITNTFTHNTDTVDVPVTKKWVDTEEQSQRRPDSIILQLKNGTEVVRTQEITAKENVIQGDDSTWQYTFEDLPKYDNLNNIINYTVDEIEKTSGDLSFYTKSINGTTITNTFTRPEDKISITVNKEWEDQNNVYEKRPDAIIIQVKQGNNVLQEKTVTKEDSWQCTFTNLDKYDENGQEIEYQVDEKEIQTDEMKYYTKEIGNLTYKKGTVTEKEVTITNKMTKLPGKVIIRYKDKNTDEEIKSSETEEGIVGETFDISNHKKEIPGYTLIEEPEDKTGTYSEETQEKTYYYAKNTNVIVKYLEQDSTKEDDGDNVVLSPQVEMQGYEGQGYMTDRKVIEGYTFIESKGKTSGTMEANTIEVVYYYAQNTSVIVKYLEQDNTPNDNTDNKVLAPEEKIEGYEGANYETEEKTISGYTFIESTNNTKGIMTKDEIEVIYYYAQNTTVTVKYLEKDNTPNTDADNKVLAQETVIEGYVGKDYETKQLTIQNYTFVESTNNTKGTMTKEPIEVIYYYAQNTKATVQHIDRETGEILKEETKTGKVGDIFQTHPEDFEGYVLVESPKEPDIIMDKTGEQVVKYYYVHISAGVIEKHIDEITGELLYSQEHKGNEGDPYDIPSKEFEGYDLVEQDKDGTNRLPENAKGEMTKDLIEVKYYYIKQATVRVEYIDKDTKEKLTEDIIIKGHEEDSYETEPKEIEGYDLLEQDKDGTNRLPENAKGKMTVTKNDDGTYNTETVVTYYYVKIAGGVEEKHIDINTGKILAEKTHQGNVGDSYNIPSREFTGYDLVTKDENGKNMLPQTSKGTMTEEKIEVIYYYIKQATVKIEYIDKDTGEKISEEEIKGHEGDPYEAEEKEFDGYDLVEVPQNSKGEMQEKEIVVKYYYKRKAEVEIQYLEKDTNYKLAETEKIEGYVGDKYETESKQIPYYNLVEQTENTKGQMTKDKITVTYYYEKQQFNLSIDKWISKVTVDGITQSAQNYNTKDQIYKLDIHRSKVNTANVKITYTIRITNTGEIEGTVGRILELIPQGYTFSQEDNKIHFEEVNGILTTDALKDETIAPGEYKEMQIVLRWENGETNFGQKDNTVILGSLSNPAEYEDINEEDNSSKSQMLISIATGLDSTDRIVVIGVVEIVLVITFGLLLSYKKKERKK